METAATSAIRNATVQEDARVMGREQNSVATLAERSALDSTEGTRWETAILLLIWLNVASIILESVSAIRMRFGAPLAAFERVSVYIFTAEYLFRVWKGGLKFIKSPLAVVDLIAIAPFYLPIASVDLRILRVARTLRVARLARVAKLSRYSAGLQTVGRVLARRQGELVAAGGIMLIVLIIAASLMYYVEGAVQPDSFSSIPATMWWAVVTLTTVGYGEVYPLTHAGRILGSVIAVLGITMFAIPAGILGAGFVDEFRQRDIVVDRCPHCGR